MKLVLVSLCVVAFLLFGKSEGEEFAVNAKGNDGLRVRIAVSGGSIVEPPVQALLVESEGETKLNGRSGVYSNGNLAVTVGNGKVSFSRVSDKKVLLETKSITLGRNNDGKTYNAQIEFTTSEGEVIYGFGEHRTGSVRIPIPYSHNFQTSQVYPLSQGRDITIPMYTSSQGYAFLWNLPSFGSFTATSNGFTWTTNATLNIDFWVATTNTSGSGYQDLLSKYAQATGLPPTFPYYASGFWQSKDRYRTQNQILEIAQGYVSRGIPISVIVIDWFNWVNFGDWSFNRACWPNPKAMIDELNSMGIEVMVSTWPLVSDASHNWQAMNKSGFLVVDSNGKAQPWHGPGQYLYDSFNPDAREFVFNAIKSGYYDFGIKTFWLDADEPERWLPDQSGEYYYKAGRDVEVGMAYPRMHQQMVHDGLKQAGESEFIMLSRSAWAGSARYGAAMWSGDIDSTFPELALQIKVAQGVAMSGIYWWTTDIGGFFNGDINDPVFQELIVRWFQFGAFCPLFRLHGCRNPQQPTNECGISCGPNEVWEFGEAAYEAIVPIMQLREQLRPYIMKNMQLASSEGTPILRPMFFEFPNDPLCQSVDVEDQYMFGPDWLVAPVYAYQASSRTVYLPKLSSPNTVWVNYFTQSQFAGGQRYTIATPLNSFPLFYQADLS